MRVRENEIASLKLALVAKEEVIKGKDKENALLRAQVSLLTEDLKKELASFKLENIRTLAERDERIELKDKEIASLKAQVSSLTEDVGNPRELLRALGVKIASLEALVGRFEANQQNSIPISSRGDFTRNEEGERPVKHLRGGEAELGTKFDESSDDENLLGGV